MAATRIYEQRRVKRIRWPQGEGGPIVPSVPPPFQMIAKGLLDTPLADMWVRDSGSFLAGEPRKHVSGWEYLTQNHPQQDLIMSWIKEGINIHEFIVPFHGTYRRRGYHRSFPPDAIFPINKVVYTPCSSYLHRDRKEDRHTLGRVGEVRHPE